MTSRNHITPRNVTASRIAGRDFFEGKKIKKTEEEATFIQYPLEWMKPKKSDGGIRFGDGIGYATGLIPSNAGSVFASGQRICLVETLTPIVTFYTFNVDYGGGPLPQDALKVTAVEKSCVIQPIPSPYVSQGSRIKYPSACQPEIIIVVLGYRNPDGRMAIAEKIRNADSAVYNWRYYPFYLSFALTGSSSSAEAAAYFYTQQEILDDPDL
jgi:hypothetical protein